MSYQDSIQKDKCQIISISCIKIAKSGSVITYGELLAINPILGMNIFNPTDRKELGKLLDQVSEDHFEKFSALLSAVVIRGDWKHPGKGFFKMAKDFNRFEGDENIRIERKQAHKILLKELHDNVLKRVEDKKVAQMD